MKWINAIDFGDIVFTVGLGLVTAGSYFVWPPAALLVPGVILMFVGWRLLQGGDA